MLGTPQAIFDMGKCMNEPLFIGVSILLYIPHRIRQVFMSAWTYKINNKALSFLYRLKALR